MANDTVEMDDARLEVEVTSQTGRVAAYASVLDNLTSDPLLVSPVQAGVTGALAGRCRNPA